MRGDSLTPTLSLQERGEEPTVIAAAIEPDVIRLYLIGTLFGDARAAQPSPALAPSMPVRSWPRY